MPERAQAGFSLAEVMVATTIFLALVLVVSSLALSGSEAQDLGRRIARMTDIGHEVTDSIRLELVSTVRMFGDDAPGNASLGMLDLAAAPLPVASRRLPTIDAGGEFRADSAGDEITGNAILFAHLAWRDRFRCSSGREYRVDVFRWLHYYLSPLAGGPAPGRRGGLDLVRWVGEPLADGDTVDDISDPADREEVLRHMLDATPDLLGQTHDAVQVVWSRNGDPTVPGTFRQIDTDGSLSDTPVNGRPDPWQVLPAVNPGGGLVGFRHASVASNFDDVAPGIARFGLRDDVAGFPHGFEAQIIGPNSARQLLVHLVLIDLRRKGSPAWSQMQTVMTGRDR
jgi:prepilin-type N-terminal cleavage/methylation domain-containing protein